MENASKFDSSLMSIDAEESIVEGYNTLLKEIPGDPTGLSLEPNIGQSATIAKFGFGPVISVINDFRKVASSFPMNLRKKYFRDSTQNVDNDLLAWVLEFFKFQLDEPIPSSQQSFLGPPTGVCYNCDSYLTTHNQPTAVTYVSGTGEILKKKKVTLRCKTCKLNYGYDKFGSSGQGYQFYNQQRDSIMATDVVLIERSVYNIQWSLAQHAWVSFEGFAESWRDAHQNKGIDRRTWAKCFWWGELEDELRSRGEICYKFKNDADLEECMSLIENIRKKELYRHKPEDCVDSCKARGCGKLWITDGIWKTQFAHCMFHVENKVESIPLANLPNICTNETVPGKAFCSFHCKYCEEHGVPTGLRSFLKYRGDLDDNEREKIDDESDVLDSSVIVHDHQYAI